MTSRSAVDTIRGYFYQFDLSILSLLGLRSDTDSIAVECIEDIDIHTATQETAVQCKYYEATEYNHSVIKTAIMHMASHFKSVLASGRAPVRYVVRGHYKSGQDKLKLPIDMGFLKKHFLTYTKDKTKHEHHQDLGLTDADLLKFLALLDIDNRAEGFDAQFAQIIKLVVDGFGCSKLAAEFFHYNSALALIRELSTNHNPSKRRITKGEFLKRIDTSGVLFNEWLVQKRGKNALFKALRKEHFSTLNASPFERFFLIEVDPGTYSRAELKELLHLVSGKWSKLTPRDGDNSFCPYVFVRGLSDDQLLDLKKELAAEEFKFADGHDFRGADFSAQSITVRATHHNGIKLKFLNSVADLEQTINAISKTRKLYQFHLGVPYFSLENATVGHVRIQVGQPSDIKSII